MDCLPTSVPDHGRQSAWRIDTHGNAHAKGDFVASLSLDGYIEATSGDPGWLFPDGELHRHFNALEGDIDTHLYGRRMYKLMVAHWPTADQNPSVPPYERDYARAWKAVPKVVFSSHLREVGWNARLAKLSAEEEVASLKGQPG